MRGGSSFTPDDAAGLRQDEKRNGVIGGTVLRSKIARQWMSTGEHMANERGLNE